MSNWYQQNATEVLQQLSTDRTTGLSQIEAVRRPAEYGPNELQATHRISPWVILFEQFKNVLIVILLVATAISVFLGHGIEAIATYLIG